MVIPTGVYTTEDLFKGIKKSVDKNKWYKLELIFRVMDDESTAIDGMAVTYIKEELSDGGYNE